MGECIDNVGGALDTEFGIGVTQVHEVVGRHHHLFNCPWMYSIMSQSIQQVQPPRDDHVVCEGEILI